MIYSYGENEQHDERLTQVLESKTAKTSKQNVKSNNMKSPMYIGHILTKNGLKADSKKTETITRLPP